MQIFLPLEKFDRDERMVYGYATTEARDSQGEIVTRAAIEAALPAYMEFANVREMHQLSAVGVVKSADLDGKGLRLQAKVVDDDAWAKVKEGVYKGLSIGGRVTQRDAINKALITGVELTEISLVDRPANPEALIDAYKAAGAEGLGKDSFGKVGARNSAADLARIQSVHDTAVALGANCPGHPDDGDDDADDDDDNQDEDQDDSGEQDDDADQDDGDDRDTGDDDDDNDDDRDTLNAVAGARHNVLAKLTRLSARIEALSRRVETQASLLQKLADEPAPPKYMAARAIEKSADGAAAPQEEPQTVLDAIKKSHRNPIRLGIG